MYRHLPQKTCPQVVLCSLFYKQRARNHEGKSTNATGFFKRVSQIGHVHMSVIASTCVAKYVISEGKVRVSDTVSPVTRGISQLDSGAELQLIRRPHSPQICIVLLDSFSDKDVQTRVRA